MIALAQEMHCRHGADTTGGKRKPPAPYTTSTMQQDAARQLGFADLAARLQRALDDLLLDAREDAVGDGDVGLFLCGGHRLAPSDCRQ